MYCLDTNIIIDYFNGVEATISFVDKLDGSLCINYMTLMELYAGCSQSAKRKFIEEKIDDLLTEISILEFDVGACKKYGQIYSILKSKGKLSETPDMIIAALCLQNNATLVTSNKKHFENIPGLNLEVV